MFCFISNILVPSIKMTSKRKQSQLTETFHPAELYNLCNKRQITCTREKAFDRIREWLNRNKDNNTRLKAALTYQGEFNNSPLHKILVIQPPVDIIQTFIDYAPETLQIQDGFGCLPIHRACQFGASLEVIRALVCKYPESIMVEILGGTLPLHLACLNNASLEVLNFLINSYPDGVDQKDRNDETPLDMLKQIEYAMKTDNEGMLPLHHACNNGYSLHLIHFLIQAYPDSTTKQDSNGKTPLQYFQKPMFATEERTKAASILDEKGRSLLHREAAHFNGLNVKFLPFLFYAYPAAAQLQDNSGLLPLHYASLNEASSLDALMLLVKLYPESIVV